MHNSDYPARMTNPFLRFFLIQSIPKSLLRWAESIGVEGFAASKFHRRYGIVSPTFKFHIFKLVNRTPKMCRECCEVSLRRRYQ